MKVYIAGHKGMVGSAICRKLKNTQNVQILTKTRKQLDLLNQKAVKQFLVENKPDAIILAAAKVGGIFANNAYPAEFIYENIQVQNNIIHFAHIANVPKLLFLGSSCIYPKFSPQPIKENRLMTGSLESTNEPYAIAKISGIKMCESYNRQYNRDYRSLMPTNLYGPYDNFHPLNSHVIPSLIRRFHLAKNKNEQEVKVWGTGKAKREFLYVDDLASACIFVLNTTKSHYLKHTRIMQSHINVGTGTDITIIELATLIKDIVGFKGEITQDLSKPDGTPRKLLDVDLINNMGWVHETSLEKGLVKTYNWFLKNEKLIL